MIGISEVKNDKLPTGLLEIKPKIVKLYGLGDVTLINSPCVAVVGSRKITSYGVRVVEKIVPYLVDRGLTIVSGGMYGVDELAHKTCMDCGGKTIAVLGWGIDQGYKNEDLKIKREIVESGGLIISEWRDEKPQRWMFPYRNRIVVGLSMGVLVIEAGEKSGSLITAELAKKWNRKLMAVPGPVTSSVSTGTNQLIKTGKAVMVTNEEEVLEELGWLRIRNIDLRIKNKATKIEEILAGEAMTVDELARKLNKSVKELGVELSIMELEGKIRQRNGIYEVRV
jgi:DNA processing protein